MIYKIFKWLFEFPQMLLGFILVKITKAQMYKLPVEVNPITYYVFKRDTKFRKFFSGCSLGDYILLGEDNCDETTIRHELGHSIQSEYLGWLYLLAAGLPSVFNNIISRINKSWNKDYYKKYPEKWADNLGGVNRQW
jgi:hypothetical protein